MDSNTVILESRELDAIVAAYRALPGAPRMRQVARLMEAALSGSATAVRGYVSVSHKLLSRLLASAHAAEPDLVRQNESAFSVVDADRRPTDYALEILELGAVEAPFSPWVASCGAERGTVLYWVSRLRGAVPGARPLTVPSKRNGMPHWEGTDREHVLRFVALTVSAIQARQQTVLPLLKVQELLGLTATELARLFGVSRQAATAWLDQGAPSARLPKLHTVLTIAELLERQLKKGRLPAVIRKPAAVYDSLSILDMIAADRQDEVLAETRRSFDWASAA